VTPKLNSALLFLKQSMLLTTKYSQKFTFNFIKMFRHTGGSSAQSSMNFNELNLRKCLTIRLSDSDKTENGKSLLQVLQHFTNPCQAENLSILLRFSLDSEGDINYWCQQMLACIAQSSNQLKLMTVIARSFVENCEFKD
jgi:hypothetical protein